MTAGPTPTGPVTKLTVALVVELAAVRILLGVVSGQGAGPWRTDVSVWLSQREPIDAAAQVSGWIALVLLCWVITITVVHLIGALLGPTPRGGTTGMLLTRVATRFGPRWIASLAATATLVTVGATGCATTPTVPDRAARTPSVDQTAVTMVVDHAPPVADPVHPEPQSPPPPTPPPPPAAPPAPSPAPTPAPRTVSVQRGGSFWTIADSEVSARLGRPATDAEIDPYWRVLIEVNRSRLVDPDDPDLLYTGQQISLP